MPPHFEGMDFWILAIYSCIIPVCVCVCGGGGKVEPKILLGRFYTKNKILDEFKSISLVGESADFTILFGEAFFVFW